MMQEEAPDRLRHWLAASQANYHKETGKVLRIWINWLNAVCVGIAIFGTVIAVAPDLANTGFSLLIYGESDRINSLGSETSAYISFAHAVLGCTLIGWGAALFLVVKYVSRIDLNLAWKIVSISVALWFVIDTTISFLSGFWPNAILNAVFAVLFAVPLVALKKAAANKLSQVDR